MGIIKLPDNAKQKLSSGKVFAVGRVAQDRMCEWTQPEADALMGKRVLWAAFGGETIADATAECGEIIQINLNHLKAVADADE